MELKTRDQVDDKYKWDLSEIYTSLEAWENDYAAVKKDYPKLTEYKGRLHEAGPLLAFLKDYENLFIKVENLLAFGFMKFSENTGDQQFQELKGRGDLLIGEIEPTLVFVKKELSLLDAENFSALVEKEPKLKVYRYFIENYSRYLRHLLGDEAEQALAEVGVALNMPGNIFDAFNDTDIVFPAFEHNGETIQLSHGTFIKYLQSPDRELRRKTYENYCHPFRKNIDILAGTYSANVLSFIKQAKIRKFKSSREMVLFDDHLETDIYDSLVSVVRDNASVVNEFNTIKKEFLNIEDFHHYDSYVPLVKDVPADFSYEDAVELVREVVSPLGEEYVRKFEASLKNRVIDVFESKQKMSGAFSIGTFSSHGYVFMNYTGKLKDVTTFAHEFGHCLHRDFSSAAQPYIYSQNVLFLAEIASTFNECLLLDHLIANAKSPEEKKDFIYQYLLNLHGTFFRQTMFADFEMQAHGMAERGEVLTAHALTELYKTILPNYLGKVVTLDDDVAIEWSRIPHFYRPFYVFKYATSISAAIVFADRVIKKEPGAVENYMKFLSAGSHATPLEILKDAGIDMSGRQVYQGAADKFKELLTLYKSL